MPLKIDEMTEEQLEQFLVSNGVALTVSVDTNITPNLNMGLSKTILQFRASFLHPKGQNFGVLAFGVCFRARATRR